MKNLYGIYDRAADAIVGNILWIMSSDIMAIRTFSDILANPQSDPAKHPDDFKLVCLGEMDDDGELPEGTQHRPPRVITTARELLDAAKPEGRDQ